MRAPWGAAESLCRSRVVHGRVGTHERGDLPRGGGARGRLHGPRARSVDLHRGRQPPGAAGAGARRRALPLRGREGPEGDPPPLRARRSDLGLKLPRDLSGRDLAKALQALGYSVTRQTGSHLRLTTTTQGEHHVTVPDHDALRVGTLSGVSSRTWQLTSTSPARS